MSETNIYLLFFVKRKKEEDYINTTLIHEI